MANFFVSGDKNEVKYAFFDFRLPAGMVEGDLTPNYFT